MWSQASQGFALLTGLLTDVGSYRAADRALWVGVLLGWPFKGWPDCTCRLPDVGDAAGDECLTHGLISDEDVWHIGVEVVERGLVRLVARVEQQAVYGVLVECGSELHHLSVRRGDCMPARAWGWASVADRDRFRESLGHAVHVMILSARWFGRGRACRTVR